jgi:DNA-binding MarR family transcriptional regulator
LYYTSISESPPTPFLEEDPLRQIGVAWRELRRGASMQALRRRIYGRDVDALELTQADALEHLTQRGPCRMRDLATLLRVDASTATRTVDRMVRDGLAERTSDADDARVVVVTATERGEQRHLERAERAHTVLTEVLSEFSPEEQRQLGHLMGRLVSSVDHYIERDELVSTKSVP